MKRRTLYFLIFSVLNVALIPLMSLYGLSICPILHVSGFFIGCAYSASYILFLNLFNFIVIYYLTSKVNLKFFKYKQLFFILSYILACMGSLIVLNIIFKINHMSSASRAPEVLILASLLLAVTQSNGLKWAFNEKENEAEAVVDNENDNDNNNKANLASLWKVHIFRLTLPAIMFAVVLLDFLLRQSHEFNKGIVVGKIETDQLVKESAIVILFLIAWSAITYLFYFLSEKDEVKKIETHLTQLGALNLNYKSSLGNSWGLWQALLQQLNEFTRVFAERTRLLKNFSKFVTENVANEALKNEINNSEGEAKELTVIMTDIRNFTSISNELEPKKVVQFLNEYFSVMLNVFTKYQITVDKFIGDGTLAYVDVENKNEQQINELAIDAAAEMHLELLKLNDKFKLHELPELKIGVGIYRGPLVIGYIGAQNKIQHTIIGDTVNKAARLESLCKELKAKTVITKQIHESLPALKQNLFQFAGATQIKGVSDKIELFIIQSH